MNFLAHAYLSFKEPDIVIGNLISDFVKGKQQYNYPISIQKGIKLHRAIDNFTDTHECTKIAKNYLKPAVGLYSGAFMDVVYDHFLALDSNHFILPSSLEDFAQYIYSVLNTNADLLPNNFKVILPSMQERNWLYNYQFLSGVDNSFKSIARRATYLSSSEACFNLFKSNYHPLHLLYKQLFPQLRDFSNEYLQSLK